MITSHALSTIRSGAEWAESRRGRGWSQGRVGEVWRGEEDRELKSGM